MQIKEKKKDSFLKRAGGSEPETTRGRREEIIKAAEGKKREQKNVGQRKEVIRRQEVMTWRTPVQFLLQSRLRF